MLLLNKYIIPYIYRKCTIETDRQTNGLKDRQTNGLRDRQTNGLRDRQTGGLRD